MQVHPFRRFNSSPENIHLMMMRYVRFSFSLLNIEDLWFKRNRDIFDQAMQSWWTNNNL